MAFYCGIDLSARTSHVCIIDEDVSVVVDKKISNELPRIINLLEPYKDNLRTVVESTFNWYWLVDGLQEAGYDTTLAHTFGLFMITGAKVKTDRRDALALAKLLKSGLVPAAYIYPKEHRSMRDLLRRRNSLVMLPGMGPILSATALYEIGEVSRFGDARHFSSYCRLVPGVAQSGGSTKKGRGSKQGNRYLKWAFTQAAIYAVRFYPEVKRCYEKHLRRHSGRARKIITYNIIGHKLALAVYAMLRDGTKYKKELAFGK